MGGTFGVHKFSRRLNGMKSRMNREVHVRNCESLRGKFPRATRPCLVVWGLGEKNPRLPDYAIQSLFFITDFSLIVTNQVAFDLVIKIKIP